MVGAQDPAIAVQGVLAQVPGGLQLTQLAQDDGQVCTDALDEDVGVIGGQDVRVGEGPVGGCRAGALVCVVAVWWSV